VLDVFAERWDDPTPLDHRNPYRVVTANLTTPYIINFTNLTDGPVLIDYPAGPTAGGVLDFWQRPVCDLELNGA